MRQGRVQCASPVCKGLAARGAQARGCNVCRLVDAVGVGVGILYVGLAQKHAAVVGSWQEDEARDAGGARARDLLRAIPTAVGNDD